MHRISILSLLLALFMTTTVSAQWGAIAPPPCNSCGNHHPGTTEANTPGCVICAEAKGDKDSSLYGRYRVSAEKRYEIIDQ